MSNPNAPRNLTCCCCGAATRGRQWHNRDTGFGLCPACIDFCARGTSALDMIRRYGYRHIHYDLQDEFLCREVMLDAIYTYARARWCWDDETFLAEQYDRLGTDLDVADPIQKFVDDLARDYDLTDPRDVGIS